MEGIILAAGLSTRLPAYKLVQEISGKPLLLHTLDTMLPFCEKVYIITGHQHKQLESLVKDYDNVVCVFNHVYKEGMFESVKLGVSLVNSDFFIMPADCPFVSARTYDQLLAQSGLVLVPSYNYKAGHPIKLDYALKSIIMNSHAPHLRAVLNQYKKTYITVDDPYVLVDIDTEDDLNQVRGRLE